MGKLYQYVALSLLATVAGFFVGLSFIPASLVAAANRILLLFLLILLLAVWIVKLARQRTSGPIRFPIWYVYLFAFVEGVLLYPSMMYYLATLGVVLFAEIVLGTMVTFAILAYMGQREESGAYTSLSRTLFVVLTVMVVLSLVNIFLRLDTLSTLLSAVGVFVFSAYILVDVNQCKTAYEAGLLQDSADYSIYVLNVYLDIIRLLQDLLHLARKLKH